MAERSGLPITPKLIHGMVHCRNVRTCTSSLRKIAGINSSRKLGETESNTRCPISMKVSQSNSELARIDAEHVRVRSESKRVAKEYMMARAFWKDLTCLMLLNTK